MNKTLNNIILVRHSRDDHSYIDGDNDTSLTPRGIELARAMSYDVKESIKRQPFKKVVVYSSNRNRAVETAKILYEELSSCGVERIFRIDGRLRELYQGKIIDVNKSSHDEKANNLEIEWKSFDAERLKGNYSYKFGEPLLCGSRKEFIAPPYGESHRELSVRARDALCDIIKIARQNDTVVIVITHRGIIREMFNIVCSVNSNVELTQYIENEMKGWEYCLPIPLGVDSADLSTYINGQINI